MGESLGFTVNHNLSLADSDDCGVPGYSGTIFADQDVRHVRYLRGYGKLS